MNQESDISKMRIIDLLLLRGYINHKDYDDALKCEKKTHHTALSYLMEHHIIKEDAIGKCLAEKHGYEYVPTDKIHLSKKFVKAFLNRIPYNLALKDRFMPCQFNEKLKILTLLVGEPPDQHTLNRIKTHLHGAVFKFKIANKSDILKMIYSNSRYFGHGDTNTDSDSKKDKSQESRSGSKHMIIAFVIIFFLAAAIFTWYGAVYLFSDNEPAQKAAAVLSPQADSLTEEAEAE